MGKVKHTLDPYYGDIDFRMGLINFDDDSTSVIEQLEYTMTLSYITHCDDISIIFDKIGKFRILEEYNECI